MSPVISVIMPVYNTRCEHLKQAIESILAQSFQKLEFIIVNDGSTNAEIEKLIASYQDERIKYFYQQNTGAGMARNKGIAQSAGKYLYFLDSDDYIAQDALEKCLKGAEDYGADLVCFASGIKNDKGKVFQVSDVHFDLTEPSMHTKFVRKDLVTRYNINFENLKVCNDLTFTYTVLANAQKVVMINEAFYFYRQGHVEALSSNRGKYATCLFDAFRCLQNNLQKSGVFDKFREDFYQLLMRCAEYELSNIRDEDDKHKFCEALKNFDDKVYKKLCGFKFYEKVRFAGGKREIYLLGRKVFSYRKKIKSIIGEE